MKKWVWGLVAVVIVGMFGGYGLTKHAEANKNYNTAMKNGKTAIQDAKYTEAENYFDVALKKKSNDATAQAYKTQVTHYKAVLNKTEARQYSKAKDAISIVLADHDGSAVIKKRATNLKKELTTVLEKRTLFTKTYNEAMNLNTEYSYTASNDKLTEILNDSSIDKNYYSDLKEKATDLQQKNDKNLATIGYPTSSSSSSSSSTSSSKSSTPSSKSSGYGSEYSIPEIKNNSSATLTSEEQAAASTYSGSNEYTTSSSNIVDGNGKAITASRIKAARDSIKFAGVNPNSFSDSDVVKIIKQAVKETTSVKAIAARDYK
ncbi:hypothetical protein ACE83Q_05885 [Dellaglioa sp. P0083]|uniref:hypothetical protein n=1 Tax=Dellaglioa kimchii TaxID=3344667 RepID=UPI0038D361FB